MSVSPASATGSRSSQTQQLSSTIALVFVHLRFVDHHAAAVEFAPLLVRYGAAATMTAALMTLVQRDLRGLYRGTTAMHGGMLMAAVGAASLDNFAAALLVAVAMGLALGGLGLMITSLEERVGPVSFHGPGGRAGGLPKLATAFALFGGAGVGLPGTAGFVADDLLLHTLWMESPTSTVTVILSSALLAVTTLIAFSRVFLGRTVATLAPDLYPRERVVVVTIVLLLVLTRLRPWRAPGSRRCLPEQRSAARLTARRRGYPGAKGVGDVGEEWIRGQPHEGLGAHGEHRPFPTWAQPAKPHQTGRRRLALGSVQHVVLSERQRDVRQRIHIGRPRQSPEPSRRSRAGRHQRSVR